MIKEAILLQKQELERRLKEPFIQRNIQIKGLENDLIKVIIGPRRAGKSFFAMHALSRKKFGYANFDDETLSSASNFNEILSEIKSAYDNPEFLLLDEIQNLEKWELVANRLQRQGYKLVVTGSNSNLLSKELATHLTGRHLQTNVFPFSFREFLFDEKLLETEKLGKFLQYAKTGGYPEPLAKKADYKDYLSTLFESVVYKDIVKRFSIRQPKAIEELALFLLSNVSKEFSYKKLSQVTKTNSVHTVKKYVGCLEEAFIFFQLRQFSFKLKEQFSTNKKIYCIDNGFINAKAFQPVQELGKAYENLVAIHLKKLEMDGHASIYYWKNKQGHEVDFLLKEGTKIKQLIQVCADLKNPQTKKREVRSLIQAGSELNCHDLLVLTENHKATETVEWFGNKAKISFKPIWKWLLEQH